MKTVKANNVTLATESFGTAEKGTILLVMGATASMVGWPNRFCQYLADAGYQVIRFDHRDTGMSTTRAPGDVNYDVADMVGDLVAIMDAYGLPGCHIVGMSLGAYVGQVLSLEQPGRVLSLTMISAEPLGIDYEGVGISAEFMEHFGKMATLDWSDNDAVADFLLGISELSAGSASPFDRAAALAEIELAISRSSNMQSAFNHSMIKGEVDPSLSAQAISVPVLIIHGSKDPVISVNAAKTSAAAIAGSQLVVLEGRGHELHADDYGRVSDAIVQFIGG